MVAKTFQGLEDVLRDELIALGAENVEIGKRMVSFEGDLRMLYKANLCCRTALRILKPIVMFTAESADHLYDYLRELPWEQFMDPDTTFSVDSTVFGDDFTHSKFVTYRVKDAIVDHFRDLNGSRPSIRVEGADLYINVHIAGQRVTVSFDSSGEPLFKRGYREEQTEAPINEVLAAGIILKTGWRGDSDFLDPMCGSGTFLIEAALIAANINPGIYREGFAFEKWKDFDRDLFEEVYEDDSEEREFHYKIFGGDNNPEAIAVARKNIKSAHVEEMIELSCRDISEWKADTAEGILVTNPPYGERLRPANLEGLYKTIGNTLKNNFQGWHAWIIGYQEEQMKGIGLKPSVKIPLFNGNLECTLREYVMFDGSYSQFRADGGSVDSEASVKEKKKKEEPRKVRRISDDDWKKESRKFNKDRGFKDRPKEDRKPRREDRESRREEKRFSRDDRRPRSGEKSFRKDDRGFKKEDRGFKREERGFKREGRGERPVKPFKAKEVKESTYNPANSKGPRLPQSSETIINPVHLRKRKDR